MSGLAAMADFSDAMMMSVFERGGWREWVVASERNDVKLIN